MGDEEKFLKIKPFDGTGFNNWRFRMVAFLEQLEIAHCVEKEADEEDFWNVLESDTAAVKKEKEAKKVSRRKQDNKCRSVLISAVADSHLEYIKDKKSPREIWTGLHEVFERKSLTNRFMLKRKLLEMKYDESSSLETHFLRFDQLVRELKSTGAKMDEEDIVCHLMLTMPVSYDSVNTAMEAVSEKLTLEFVKGKYLDIESKRKGRKPAASQESEEVAFAGKSGKYRLKCFGCGKLGHKRADCPESGLRHEKRDFEKKKPTKFSAAAKTVSFVAGIGARAGSTTDEKSRCWYLDSGASDHMANQRQLFRNLEELENPVLIATAKKGVNLVARHRGEINVFSIVDGEPIHIRIENVLFVPELALNLLSLRRLESSGKKVIFHKGKVVVEDEDRVIVATGKQSGVLYAMDFHYQTTPNSAFVTGKITKELELWHQRFGHIGDGNLLKLINKDMVDGLELACEVKPGTSESMVCEPCLAGKQTREPFISREGKRTTRPLELVHSDVCGPISPVAWDGMQYFITFTDDYTHLTVVYLMASKDEALECLKTYEAMATAHFRTKMSRLRCDNGGEYSGKQMKMFCRQKGIQLEMTVPYTPEQNGLSERMNRTIVEKVRAMLSGSGVSKRMWGEAVYTAVYLINRSPTVAVDNNRTPFEAWNRRKPNVSNLRVFGVECFVHVPKQKRKKLDSKSEKAIFVGYAPNGYRVWNGRKVFVARDIVFNEGKINDASKTSGSMNEEAEGQLFVIQGHVSKPASIDAAEEHYDDGDHGDSEANVEEDLDDTLIEEAAGGDTTESELRRNCRNCVPPAWHKDYNLSAFALSAEEYVDNIPSDIAELKKREDWPLWKEAIEAELFSLEKNRTWTLTKLPAGRQPVGNKWVFTIKRDGEGKIDRYKARLVAKGFTQTKGFDYEETYSPVAKMTTLRILLALANQRSLHVHQMDVKTTFLNGSLAEEIYMKQPSGFDTGNNLVCKLNKAIYGLKQASRSWNMRFHTFITSIGFKRSQYDHCLYHWSQETETIYLVIYVDDILMAANSIVAIKNLKRKLSREFEMKDLDEVRCFLGLNITWNKASGVMTIDQKQYVMKILHRFGMADCRPSAIPMDPHLKLLKCEDAKLHTKKPYKELIGCLMYLMITSRPDICAAVSYFASFQCCATDEHWAHVKRILMYLRATVDNTFVFRRSTEAETLSVYADADWGNNPNDRRSVSGYVVQLYGATISWATRKQTSVALSTTEAEFMALCQASCEAMWVVNLLKMLDVEVPLPMTVYEDNQPCIAICQEPRKHRRMKHIDIQYFFLRDLIEEKKIKLQYQPTENQIADIMTKGLPVPRFRKLREMLGLIN